MPPLPNARTELFSQGIAAGKSATQAYSDAGYKPSRSNAAMLLRKQNISDRVAEIIREKAEIHRQGVVQAIAEVKVTTESLLAELDEARALARQKEDPRSMIQGSMGKGRLAGLLVERHQVQQVASVEDLSDEELASGQINSLIRMAEGVGLDWETCLFREVVDRLTEMLEEGFGGEERTDYGRAASSSRGIRAPEWKPQQRAVTRGEAELRARKPNAPKVVAGVINK